LKYDVGISDNCRTAPTVFLTRGIANGGIVPIGATTSTLTAVDSGGLSSSCSFTVIGNLDGQQCDDEISVTSGDRCIASQVSNRVLHECAGGCVSSPVNTNSCPIADNVAFQLSNNGAKFCTRFSTVCEGGRCKTGAGSFQQLITIGRITMVGELASFVGNAPLLAQFGGDYAFTKVTSETGGVVLVGVASNSNNSGGNRIEFAINDCFVRLFTRDGLVKVIGGSLSPLPASIAALLQ